jgi:hypothetical protein
VASVPHIAVERICFIKFFIVLLSVKKCGDKFCKL